MSKEHRFTRRAFLGTSLAGVAGLTLIPGCRIFRPSDTVRLGFIGLGRQSMYLLSSFIRMEGVKVVAGADVYGIKNLRFEREVKNYYAESDIETDVQTYTDYRELLEREDIDAVVIASPDHWHYHMATDAVSSGKDVYLEKPLTFTIPEGQKLVEAVRAADRILGVGSQQRSDPGFIHAVDLVKEGRLGPLRKVDVYVGPEPFPIPYDLPVEEVPADLDWNGWLGPNPRVHYNHELNPPISLDPPSNEEIWGAWRWYKETGGGLMTDWGAHMFDIGQWGLGTDRSGPVRVIPPGYENNEYLKYVYDSGLEMELKPFDEQTRGVKFWGIDAWVEVSRGKFNASEEELKPVVKETETPYEARNEHHLDFIRAVKDHEDPVVPVEIGHRTNTVCVLGNIAHELGRPLDWDPENEQFRDDAEATGYLSREYNNRYSL